MLGGRLGNVLRSRPFDVCKILKDFCNSSAQPHDGGLSLGQALFVWYHILDNPRTPAALSPYLGTDAGEINEDFDKRSFHF